MAVDDNGSYTMLEIRGEGTVVGTRQKGQSDLKLTGCVATRNRGPGSRGAFCHRRADPTMSGHEVLREQLGLLVEPEEGEFLFKS